MSNALHPRRRGRDSEINVDRQLADCCPGITGQSGNGQLMWPKSVRPRLCLYLSVGCSYRSFTRSYGSRGSRLFFFVHYFVHACALGCCTGLLHESRADPHICESVLCHQQEPGACIVLLCWHIQLVTRLYRARLFRIIQ